MSDFHSSLSPFLQKVVVAIEENLADENYGVSELASQVNMSRSNLLRKVKNETGVSVSVFIRQVRLHHAKSLLKDDALTVSEISFKVGFNSTSYFTKCFREEYGYTPGEEGSRTNYVNVDNSEETDVKRQKPKKLLFLGLAFIAVAIVAVLLFVILRKESDNQTQLRKTIAVLPFKNDSSDSTNVYFMNGLMEAILDNFQKIEDIQVTSRTTVEKYRGVSKSIPELSKELNVNYFVEGSGQKVGNEVLLTIQLIEAPGDKHIWSQRYKREITDIFQLQMDVARSIAKEIDAIITPEENQRIEKIPTKNLVAYDYYLKGLELLKKESGEVLFESIDQFKKAILEDGEFANAYAYIAIAYYYLDIYQAEKKFTQEVKTYSDKAILLDDDIPESLIAKALYHMQIEQYNLAIASFEEVLSYYPNSGWVHNFLSSIYATQLPNTEKYLSHALRGIQIAVADKDSVTASYTYLHLGNALAQSGFIDEAEKYIQKSMSYNPQNIFSEYVHIYIKLAQNFDLVKAKESLIKTLQKDTTRIDVIQEIAKVCYTMESYEESWSYYSKLIDIKLALKLDIYNGEDIKISYVLGQLGRKEESEKYLKSYLEYAENDQSIYKDLSLSAYYATIGNLDRGIKHLKAFSEMENYQYWFVLFLEKDPIILQMSGHPEFKKTIKKINDKFWAKHEEIKMMLEEEGVI